MERVPLYRLRKVRSEAVLQLPNDVAMYRPSFHLLLLGCVSLMVHGVEQALVELYYSTGGSQWNNNENWLIGDPCTNSWFGVSCDTESFVVTQLYVPARDPRALQLRATVNPPRKRERPIAGDANLR